MKKILAFVALAAFPVVSFAQQLTDINKVAEKATNIGNLIITLAISFAILWIIVSVVLYLIKGASDEEAREKGKQAILYGVIGLFVILSIWGFVAILRNSFKTQDQQPTTEIEKAATLPTPKSVPN